MNRTTLTFFSRAALFVALSLAAAWPAGAQTPIKLGYTPSLVQPGTTDPENAGVGITSNGSIVAGYSKDWNSGTGAYVAWVWEASNPVLVPLPMPDGYTDCGPGTDYGSSPRVINDAGQIVGWCAQVTADGETAHQACLWQKTGGVWTVTPLGYLEVHDWSEALSINEAGQVIVHSLPVTNPMDDGFFIWDTATGARLALPPDFQPIGPVSSDGLVAGMTYVRREPPLARVWDTGEGDFVWGRSKARVMAISPSGVVAGVNIGEFFNITGVFARTPDGDVTDLPALPLDPPGFCADTCTLNGYFIELLSVNDAGDVLIPVETSWYWPEHDKDIQDQHLFLWNGTDYVNVGTDLPEGMVDYMQRTGMNASGQVFINALDPATFNLRAYFWTGSGPAQVLQPLSAGDEYRVTYINDAGQMVGESGAFDPIAGGMSDYATAWGVTAAGVRINNIPSGAVYRDQFTPTYDDTGDGRTSATSSTLDVCTISRGGVVKFVGVGTCTLTAHAAAGATSPAIDGAPQPFNVGKAPASITIKNIPKHPAYGDTFKPTYTFTGDGTKSATSSTPGVCRLTADGRVQFVGVGACTLVAHIGEGPHYLAGDGGEQTFEVGRAAATITIDNIPKGAKKGGSFVPTYKYAGDGSTTVTSSTPKVCTTDGTTVSFVGSGPCTLTAHAAEGTLYLATDGKAQSFPVAK